MAAAREGERPLKERLRLAAMAGHMQVDRVAARRGALIDLLADGRPHTREAIWEAVANQLEDADCWGKLPREALARDLAVLRQGGIRIGYSRRRPHVGYYLQYPAVKRPFVHQYEAPSPQLIDAIKKLSPAEKNERTFASAAFVLKQKRLLLAEENPDWSEEAVDIEARRQVYRVDINKIVIAKLRAYKDSQSTRHLDDIASIIRVRRSKLDQKEIEQTVAQLGLFGVWRSLWETDGGLASR